MLHPDFPQEFFFCFRTAEAGGLMEILNPASVVDVEETELTDVGSWKKYNVRKL